MEEIRSQQARHLSLHASDLSSEEMEMDINRNLNEEVSKVVSYQPMRITLFTAALDLQKTDASSIARVNFITKNILSHMAQFWSDALSVVPVDGNLIPIISSVDIQSLRRCQITIFWKGCEIQI